MNHTVIGTLLGMWKLRGGIQPPGLEGEVVTEGFLEEAAPELGIEGWLGVC